MDFFCKNLSKKQYFCRGFAKRQVRRIGTRHRYREHKRYFFRILSGLIDEEKYGIISLTINETHSGILPRIRDKKGQCEMKEENDVRAGKVQSVTEILIELGFLKIERVKE